MEKVIPPTNTEAAAETNDGREVWFYRADGDLICDGCERKYFRHPFEATVLGYDQLPFLRRLCDGDLVKL